MNGISGGDLEYLKDGLRMDGDSVVDLDRSSMIDVVKKAGVDLESPQFANLDGLGGDFSTASAKLSRFFNEESDPRKIASVISELLDVRVARATIQNLDQQLIAEVSYQKSRAIVERLSARHIGNGRAPVTLNDDDFEYQHAWEPGYRIFISHSSVDSNLAGQFKKSLRAYGFAAFLAHDDIDAPDHWPVVIEHALSSAHAVAPLLSENWQ